MDEALSREEREGLTIWGETISAQFRDEYLALYVRDDAPRDVDGPVKVPIADVLKLHALIAAADERGEFRLRRG